MANITGLQTVNETAILEIDGDPRLSGGLDRSIGDLAIDTLTGDIYIKKTVSPTGWEHINQKNNFNYTASSIESTNSTTHQTITQLISDSLPIGSYEFSVYGIYQSSATGRGIGFRLNQQTATIDSILANWKIKIGLDVDTDAYVEYPQQSLTTDSFSISSGAANTDLLFFGFGFFTVSTAGSVNVQFRSENTGGAVSVRPGSSLVIRRVA